MLLILRHSEILVSITVELCHSIAYDGYVIFGVCFYKLLHQLHNSRVQRINKQYMHIYVDKPITLMNFGIAGIIIDICFNEHTQSSVIQKKKLLIRYIRMNKAHLRVPKVDAANPMIHCPNRYRFVSLCVRCCITPCTGGVCS